MNAMPATIPAMLFMLDVRAMVSALGGFLSKKRPVVKFDSPDSFNALFRWTAVKEIIKEDVARCNQIKAPWAS